MNWKIGFLIIYLAICGLYVFGVFIQSVIYKKRKQNDEFYIEDKIHDRRRKMKKGEQINYLLQQIKELKKELEYVEHKNDKARIETETMFYSTFDKEEQFYLIYPEHYNRKIQKINIGLYFVGLTQTYANNVKILKETHDDIYVEFKNNVVPYDSIIKKIHKINGNITEMDAQNFETLKELFETKPKKSKKGA